MFHRIVCAAEKLATETLSNHKAQLQSLAEALLQRETLDKNAIDELFANPQLDSQPSTPA